MKKLSISILILVAATSAGCDFFGEDSQGYYRQVEGVIVDTPEVEVGKAKLVANPSIYDLGAYYCPQLWDVPLVEQACALALGPVPNDKELAFRFQLPITVYNPNDFPLPAVELLTVLNLFPGEDRRQLAALCISFCEDGDLACAETGAGTCESDEPEINSLEDFATAALNYIWLYLEAELTDQVPPELKVKTIPAGADMTISITLELSPDAILDALMVTFENHLQDVIDSEQVAITIPYDVEGALWFEVTNFGRFGVNFGPLEGEWVISTD